MNLGSWSLWNSLICVCTISHQIRYTHSEGKKPAIWNERTENETNEPFQKIEIASCSMRFSMNRRLNYFSHDCFCNLHSTKPIAAGNRWTERAMCVNVLVMVVMKLCAMIKMPMIDDRCLIVGKSWLWAAVCCGVSSQFNNLQQHNFNSDCLLNFIYLFFSLVNQSLSIVYWCGHFWFIMHHCDFFVVKFNSKNSISCALIHKTSLFFRW